MKLDVDKALKHPVVMVTGEEAALRRHALEELLEGAGVQKDDFDLQGFDGDSNAVEWLAAAGTAPFLAERRTVIVRHVLRGDPEVARDLGWKAMPPSSLLILVADEEIGDEDKQRRFKSVRTAWEKLIGAVGGYVIKCNAATSDFKDLVRLEALRQEKKITDRALDVLAEMSAGSVSKALEEIPKLSLYVGPEASIQESDVRAVVVPSREWNVFKIVDAVVEGDTGTALRQLRILVGSTSKAEEAAFRNLLPQLSRNLRLIWQARVCIDAKTTPDKAPESVRDSFLPKPNLNSEADFVRNKCMRAARNLTLSQIAGMLQLVSDCDARLKGILPGFSAMETLEQTILKMIDVVRPKVALR